MRRSVAWVLWTFVGVAAAAQAGGQAGAAAAGGGSSWADERADPELSVQVSPGVINLDAPAAGDWVTVHTDIAYRSVDTATVALNGVPAALTYPDDRGNLVAKFAAEAIAAIVFPPATELALTGLTTGGVAFAASDVVRVLDPLE